MIIHKLTNSLQPIPMILGNACSEAAPAHPCARGIRASMHIMCPFSFRARHDDAHGPPPLQRGRLHGCSRLITSGTRYLATAALSENGRAMNMNMHFQISWVYTPK